MERNYLILWAVLCLIVALYGLITLQWGITVSFIFLIVPIILIFEILQKIVKNIETSREVNLKLASDVESLKESINYIQKEISEIKEFKKEDYPAP